MQSTALYIKKPTLIIHGQPVLLYQIPVQRMCTATLQPQSQSHLLKPPICRAMADNYTITFHWHHIHSKLMSKAGSERLSLDRQRKPWKDGKRKKRKMQS